MYLWYALKKLGVEGLRKRYQHSLETAEYCKNKLNEIGINAWVNPGAITVVLPKTPLEVKQKWQLATESDISHVICMPNVTKAQIDEFIYDIVNSKENIEEAELVFEF